MQNSLTAEISASAIRTNLGLLRRRLEPGTKLCAVVKADCYGHGLRTLLGVICEAADCLAVATAPEALALRGLGCERPILMFFGPGSLGGEKERAEALAELITENVTLTAVCAEDIAAAARAGLSVGADAEVHVKIDTGMNRSGAPHEAAPALICQARESPGVKLTGLYTHLACADEADKGFARVQLDRFREAVRAGGGAAGLTLHAANSAALIDLPETHLDMVRPGIAMYGYQPSDEMLTKLPLVPALRLTGPLMQIKDVRAGSGCGYGLTHTFRRDGRIGLVPVGYADGYFRCLSNRATMRVAGRDCPVRGRVSMDQVIIDLTDAPAARVGDEVEIISPDPSAPHSVEGLCRLAGTIPYELLCRLGRRVDRVPAD